MSPDKEHTVYYSDKLEFSVKLKQCYNDISICLKYEILILSTIFISKIINTTGNVAN